MGSVPVLAPRQQTDGHQQDQEDGNEDLKLLADRLCPKHG